MPNIEELYVGVLLDLCCNVKSSLLNIKRKITMYVEKQFIGEDNFFKQLLVEQATMNVSKDETHNILLLCISINRL